MQTDSARNFMNRFTWAGLLLAALSITACDSLSDKKDEGAMIQARLIRMPSENAVAGKTGAMHSVNMAASSGGPAWTSEVTIHSLRTPITRIWITNEHETLYNAIYECDPTPGTDECMVDLHGTALQNLLDSTPYRVMPGTYTQVGLSNCALDDMGYNTMVAGSAFLGGTLMYTKADGGLSETGPAEEASVPHSGCGTLYPFSEPLVISDTIDTPIPLQLYFDMQHIARVADGTPETAAAFTPGGCTGTFPDQLAEPKSFVCIAYPDVAATIATETPRLERYRVNQNATIGLFFHPESDKPLGGYTRRYHVEGEAFDPGFGADTPLREVIANGDGTYTLSNYGGSRDDYAFRAVSFERANHSGTFTSTDHQVVTPVSGSYTAVKLAD